MKGSVHNSKYHSNMGSHRHTYKHTCIGTHVHIQKENTVVHNVIQTVYVIENHINIIVVLAGRKLLALLN